MPILTLEECDPAYYLPCAQQEAFVSIPITDTGAYLTYSSRWTPGPSGQHLWDADTLGLGGWSINFVQHYDKANRLLVSGDGSWRHSDGVALPSGELAVPSYDGATAYIFDSAGRHIRTVDGHLGTELLKISYDSAGRLAKLDGFMKGQPMHLSVRRDGSGRAQSLVGTDGGTTILGLDGGSRLVSATSPAGATTGVVWNAAGLVESVTDPAGGVVRFTYDSSGRLASLTDADGIVQRFDYSVSSSAFEARVSTAQGRHWSYRAESTSGGIRRTYVAQDGTSGTETTDAHGARVLKLADGASYSIGALANPVWGMASPILSPIIATRPDGVTSRREVKYALQPQHGIPYVLAGSVTTTINGQPWIEHYDPVQRSATLVDPTGRRTTTVYDTQGHVLNYSAPGAAPVSYTYNSEGRVESATMGSGKLAYTTRYTYKASTGEVVSTRADGTTSKVAVDKAGQVVSATAGDGSTTLAGYNAAGRLIQIQPPGGLNYTLGASPAGRATGFAPPMVEGDGSVETTAYDKDGQPAAISGPGNRAINYTYDSGGRVTTSTFDQDKASISYDAHSGLRNQATDPSGVTTSYGYAGSTLNHLAWSGPVDGSVSMALDANGEPIREDVNGSNALNFTYDAAGNLTGVGPLSLTRDATTGLVTRMTLGAVETRQEFDGNGLLSRSMTTAGGKLVLEDRYTRDQLGRIKTVTETGRDGKTLTAEYFYDRADRLASVRVNGSVVEADMYDPAGNRIAVVRPSGKVTAKYDARERPLNWGSIQYAWAPDGNLARRTDPKGTTSFTYDDFGALRRVTLADGRAIKYLVDADGRRVGRELAGKLVAQYLYRPDGSIAAELDSTGKVVSRFSYDHLGHLAVVERGGVTYRVITDSVGSPRLIIDSRSGAVAEEIIYDAWGNVTRDTAPGFIPIGFAGGLRDPDTGLIRFGARDYDPELGRWSAADPIRFAGGDSNLYRYAAADPVNLSDPTGLTTTLTVDQNGVCTSSGQCLGLPPPGYPTGPNGHITVDQYGMCNSIGQCFGFPPPGYPTHNGPGSGNGGNNGNGDNPPGNGGNPPGTGNPPPPGNPGQPWSCSGLTCSGPGGQGCVLGSCSNGPNGFQCWGLTCQGPDNNNCVFCSMGDVHLWTASATHFDFQGAGEFLVASDAGGKLVIQARQEPLGGTDVTFNTAVAASVNGDRVGVYAREPSFLVVNGTPADQADVKRRLPHGGMLERHGGVVRISWPEGGRLTVTQVANTLNYYFTASAGVHNSLRGLLSGAESARSGALLARSGTLLDVSDPGFQAKLYPEIGNSWRIKQSESLFHYWPGESTAKFTNLSIPSKTVTSASLSSEARSEAEADCRAFGVQAQPLLNDCILDVGVTGMPAFAAASTGVSVPVPPPSRTPTVLAANSATAASAPAASSAGSLASDHYAINIGDTVSPDHPSAGAGMIRKAGEKQSYLFSGQAGQIVYVKFGACDGVNLHFDLHDPANWGLGGAFGCHDFGPVTLAKSGTYQLLTYPDPGGASARYSFSILPTTFEQYSTKIGDTVSPDHPAKGAGSIVRLGERQSYSFPGQAGEIVYVKFGACDGVNLHFEIHDPANWGLGGTFGCHDFGPVTLTKSGTYQLLTFPDTGGASAHYSFSILPTTFEKYSIKIGDTVSPDHPAKGAGSIVRLGERQLYSFAGKAGEVVYVKFGACDGANLHFEVHDPTNWGLGGTFGCHDFGPLTLAKSGTYQLLIYPDSGSANAHYAFSVSANSKPMPRR